MNFDKKYKYTDTNTNTKAKVAMAYLKVQPVVWWILNFKAKYFSAQQCSSCTLHIKD